eukprot:c21572_g1_i1 orf=250-759(-)
MCPSGRDAKQSLWKRVSGHCNPLQLKEAFCLMDKDGDGEISASDLKAFFASSMAGGLDAEELESMIAYADKDGDGVVNYQEFESLLGAHEDRMNSSLPSPSCNGFLEEIFQTLDENGDGVLCQEDLKSFLRKSGQQFSEEELQIMLDAASGTNKPFVSFDDFVEFMMAT